MNSKAFFMIISLYLGLQINTSFASEKKQSWLDWFRSKLTSSNISSVAVKTAKTKTFARSVTPLVVKFTGMKPNQVMDILDLFWTSVEDIESIISFYRTGSINQKEAIQKIKNDLLIIVNNQLLYPTRSSKINALLKKDEFLQYVDNQDELIQDACNQLIKEISAMDYSATKKAADEAIDLRMATLRAAIMHGQSLTEQIQELEKKIDQKQHFDIPEMQAYLSLYFRLKNKQTVEGKLTKEEKEFQQPWNIDASKIEKQIVSEPEID